MKEKITNTIFVTVFVIWTAWTLLINGCYLYAAICDGTFEHLEMGDSCTFINFIVNGMFVVTFMVATLIKKAKARKSK